LHGKQRCLPAAVYPQIDLSLAAWAGLRGQINRSVAIQVHNANIVLHICMHMVNLTTGVPQGKNPLWDRDDSPWALSKWA
jgi:hypothetical protein